MIKASSRYYQNNQSQIYYNIDFLSEIIDSNVSQYDVPMMNRRDSGNSREGNRCRTWEKPRVHIIIPTNRRGRPS